MAPRSRRGRVAAAAVAALLGGGALSAHRLDECLQAARLGIDPARVELALDVTPGVAVAADVLEAIDVNRDDAISPAEAATYATRLLAHVSLAIDGERLPVALVEAGAPAPAAMRDGLGTVRIRAAAALPELAAGAHRLDFRNGYRPDVSVYLANALVPSDDRIAVTGQARDDDQRTLRIAFTVRGATAASTGRWWLAGLAIGLLAAAGAWRSRRPWLSVPHPAAADGGAAGPSEQGTGCAEVESAAAGIPGSSA